MGWSGKGPWQRRRRLGRRGFTLVELLVVIGIIGLLLSLLLPALTAVRRRTRSLQCTSNLRQLANALICYANDHRGAFPINMAMPSPGRSWSDPERAGKFLMGITGSKKRGGGGGPLACPEDYRGMRSYAMNFWASSAVDSSSVTATASRGSFWKAKVSNSSRMILVTERWSTVGSDAEGWYATATVGSAGSKPGQRFGAGSGIVPPMAAARWGLVICELPYSRHGGDGNSTAPRGCINIAYADGHVVLKAEKELADLATGLSTLDSMWSPMDPLINK